LLKEPRTLSPLIFLKKVGDMPIYSKCCVSLKYDFYASHIVVVLQYTGFDISYRIILLIIWLKHFSEEKKANYGWCAFEYYFYIH